MTKESHLVPKYRADVLKSGLSICGDGLKAKTPKREKGCHRTDDPVSADFAKPPAIVMV